MNPPRILRVAVQNPFFEGRNSIYVILSEPVTMIDTGVATDNTFATLRTGLQEHGVRTRDIKRIVLTHKHIDHSGNAWRIQRESGAEILIHESEIRSITHVDHDGEHFASMVSRRLTEWKVPDSDRPSGSDIEMPAWNIEPAEAQNLVDGQQISMQDGYLEVIHTPGHTIGSICLRYGSYLFSGDHVLRHTSPNIGGGDMNQQGLLGHYLESLNRIRNEDDGVEVLPGHGRPFHGLRDRCDELRSHHEERLDSIRVALADGGQTVYQVARFLFGALEGFHVVLGCAEANAHLEVLQQRGQVQFESGKYRLGET